MLIKHNTSSPLTVITPETCVSSLEQAKRIIDELLDFRSKIDDYRDEMISIDDLFESMCESVIDGIPELLLYAEALASSNIAMNNYLRETINNLYVLNQNLSMLDSFGIYPSDEEIDRDYKCAYKIISGLVYFIWYEFSLYATYEDLNNGVEDYTVNEIMKQYLDINLLSMEEMLDEISSLKLIYKIKLQIFDEHPELEEPFERVMGPYLAGIDTDLLTLQNVEDVINGNKDASSLYSIFVKQSFDLYNKAPEKLIGAIGRETEEEFEELLSEVE